MSELTTVARPYAIAAFDYAVANDAIDNWQTMLGFAAAVAQDEQIRQYISGAVAAEKVAELFNNICADQLDEHGQNFIKILSQNSRLAALPEISTLFNTLKYERERTVDVDVVSAATLDEAQQTKLSAALEKRFDRKVKLNCSVDPTLVAGMVIKAGDTVIDGSVNSQLNRLNDALQA